MIYAAEVFRFAVATVFLLAAVSKLPRLDEFEGAVANYRLLPGRLARPLARALPPAELGASLLLALGLATRLVAGLLALTLCLFAGAVAANLLRGRSIDCGCFGPIAEHRITWWSVARNLLLAGMAGAAVAAAPLPLSLDSLLSPVRASALPSSGALGLMVVGTLAVLGAAVAQEAGRLRQLRRTFSLEEAR